MLNFEKKYKPTCIDDVVFPSVKAKQVVDNIVSHKVFKHVIFEGSYGTGKSTLLRLIPEAVFSPSNPKTAIANKKPGALWEAIGNVDCKAMDGFDCSGVEDVRTKLRKIVNRGPTTNIDIKFITIDEFDGMSPKAQQALKGLLDQADDFDTCFLFATNNYYSLDAGVRDRCIRVKMDDFDPDLWLPRLHTILQNEGVDAIDENLLLKLVISCDGHFRQVLQKLQNVVNKHHERKAELDVDMTTALLRNLN